MKTAKGHGMAYQIFRTEKVVKVVGIRTCTIKARRESGVFLKVIGTVVLSQCHVNNQT